MLTKQRSVCLWDDLLFFAGDDEAECSKAGASNNIIFGIPIYTGYASKNRVCQVDKAGSNRAGVADRDLLAFPAQGPVLQWLTDDLW